MIDKRYENELLNELNEEQETVRALTRELYSLRLQIQQKEDVFFYIHQETKNHPDWTFARIKKNALDAYEYDLKEKNYEDNR